MPNLTRREQRRLEVTGNVVRMYVACITFVFPILCVVNANRHYTRIAQAGGIPEIPPAATYGTIMGIYLPLFAGVAAYVWATRAFPKRQAAPHGYAMALFRDAFTVVVVTVVLYLPVLLYALPRRTIQDVNTLLVWYQTIITAVAGAAFAYYFHASISPAAAKASDAAPVEEAMPASPVRRRRAPRQGPSPTAGS
jgi:hypothetical protein